MSYDYIPTISAIQNGAPIDAEVVDAAYASLSEMARALAADLLGRQAWFGGGDTDSDVSGKDLFAQVKAGDWYTFEPPSLQQRALNVATRSRQPDREIQVTKSDDLLVSFIPNNTDDRLAALTLTHAYTVRPPEGAVSVAWLGTGFDDIHAIIDARPHVVYGAVVNTDGADVRSRKIWVPVSNAKLAVTLYPGEALEVSLHATATDGLIQAFLDKNRLPKDRTDSTQIILSFNGAVVYDLALMLGIGLQTSVPTSRTYYAEWVVDPFLPPHPTNPPFDGAGGADTPSIAERIFHTPDPSQGGTVLIELVARGFAVSVDTLWMGLRVRPKELLPV